VNSNAKPWCGKFGSGGGQWSRRAEKILLGMLKPVFQFLGIVMEAHDNLPKGVDFPYTFRPGIAYLPVVLPFWSAVKHCE